MDLNLFGKKALLTGASSGFELATARLLAAEGHRLPSTAAIRRNTPEPPKP